MLATEVRGLADDLSAVVPALQRREVCELRCGALERRVSAVEAADSARVDHGRVGRTQVKVALIGAFAVAAAALIAAVAAWFGPVR